MYCETYDKHKNICRLEYDLAECSIILWCKFDFPRPVSESFTVNDVEDSLKSKRKIYQLARAEQETRVNDYNPLRLMLWKANMDIQKNH